MKYRKTPYSQKRSTSDFILLVGKCLSHKYLHRERVRKISRRRAREYMAAYFILSLEGVEMDKKGDNSSEENAYCNYYFICLHQSLLHVVIFFRYGSLVLFLLIRMISIAWFGG